MKVVITGSLGHIGKPLATELTAQGHQVTIISSNPEKKEAIEALGAHAAIGSLEDAGFVAATFAAADALFAMVPPNFSETDQIAYYRRIGNNYQQALRSSAIRQVVHLSSYGAHLDKGTGFILGAHHVENILNELPDTAVTHLRPGYFYYNLYGFTGMIKTAGMMGANYGGEDKIVLVAPSDIATAAAEEITATPAARRKIRYVASDTHTAEGIARVLGAAIGKPDLHWVTFTNEQMQSGLEEHGVPAHAAANLVELGASIHSGALLADYELHPPQLGKVKLADFAKEFAAAY